MGGLPRPQLLDRPPRTRVLGSQGGGVPEGLEGSVDVPRLPENAFGYVPTPAVVAPIEFTLRRDDYAALGGHMDAIRDLDAVRGERLRIEDWPADSPWPFAAVAEPTP